MLVLSHMRVILWRFDPPNHGKIYRTWFTLVLAVLELVAIVEKLVDPSEYQ